MSLKFFHQVIIFAAISISLIFAGYCFFSDDVAGMIAFKIAGVVALFAVVALVAYEIHFLKKTRKLIL